MVTLEDIAYLGYSRLALFTNDFPNQSTTQRNTRFVPDTESDLMPPIPPTRTRSKMHDLAVKHRLITDQVTLK